MSARRELGFSLIEVATVLLIGGLLLMLGSRAYQNASGFTDRQAAQAHLAELAVAIDSFALSRGRLPCPDTDGDGREDSCDQDSLLRTGQAPYESLDLPIPEPALRARYGVYRESGEDLAVAEDTSGDGKTDYLDLIRRLTLLATQDEVTREQIYLTGDGGALGPVECSSNAVTNPAYLLVVPGEDRNGDGSRFDSPHTSGLCTRSPGTPEESDNDDRVLALSAAELAGWLRNQ